jgi:hypothetical protein
MLRIFKKVIRNWLSKHNNADFVYLLTAIFLSTKLFKLFKRSLGMYNVHADISHDDNRLGKG